MLTPKRKLKNLKLLKRKENKIRRDLFRSGLKMTKKQTLEFKFQVEIDLFVH